MLGHVSRGMRMSWVLPSFMMSYKGVSGVMMNKGIQPLAVASGRTVRGAALALSSTPS